MPSGDPIRGHEKAPDAPQPLADMETGTILNIVPDIPDPSRNRNVGKLNTTGSQVIECSRAPKARARVDLLKVAATGAILPHTCTNNVHNPCTRT